MSAAALLFVGGTGFLFAGIPGFSPDSDDIEVPQEEQQPPVNSEATRAAGETTAPVSTTGTAAAPVQMTQTIATVKCTGDGDPDEDDWEGDDEDDKQNCVTVYTTVPVATSGASGATGTGSATPAPAPTPKPTPTPAPATSGYTLADVSKHNTASDCWSVVSGKIYNLTSWISPHPGGRQEIISMCGIDATSAYLAQHSGAKKPAAELAPLFVANLSQ